MVPSVFEVGAIALVIFSVVYQAIRYRGSTGDSRQQLKWLMGGGIVCLLSFVALGSGTADGGASLAAQIWSQIPWIAFSAVPISIGIAVLKHRLYEIDRLVSRTLSYAILTALLVGTFVGLVVLTTDLLPFFLAGRGGRIDPGSGGVCSTRYENACSTRSIAGSTGLGTTLRRQSRRSPPACATRSTSMRSRASCSTWSSKPLNPPTRRSGSGTATRRAGQEDGAVSEPSGGVAGGCAMAGRIDGGAVRRRHVPLAVLADQATAGNLLIIPLMIPFGAVGVVVANRQPRNAIGWILIALALTVVLGTDAGFYAVLAYRLGDHWLPLGRLAVALSPAWIRCPF